MTPQPHPIFFDLDGTLTDPREGIVGSIRHALDRLGHPIPDERSLDRLIGPPLAQSFAVLLETDDRDRIEEAVRLYRERFADVGLFENRVYPGVAEALRRLDERGHALYVVSSKAHVFLEPILEHFGLREPFRALYGAELDGTRADKGELIAWVLEREGFGAEAPVMVGDREHDVIGARKNGVTALGVAWGYGSREELRAAGAERILEAPAELVSAFVDPGAPS